MQSNIKHAKIYLNAGWSVVPTNGNKRPIVKSWEHLQKAPMTDGEAAKAFRNAAYIAVITGAVSGNVELIDVDCKWDLEGNLWSGYSSAIQEAAPELWQKLTIQKTQNGGFHILYRCSQIAGNAKLASRAGTPKEVAAKNEEIAAWNAANPDQPTKKTVERVIKTLIETRGEGGYALVYPSEGYEVIQGSLLNVQEITPAEREILFKLATIYNTIATTKGSAAPQSAPTTPTHKKKPAPTKSVVSVTPWQDFIDQHSALDLLNQITPFYEVKNSRDGKGRSEILLSTTPNGEHNATYYPNENKCFVFTTNTPLPTETPLNPFDLYVIANYGSDTSANRSAAASDLYKAGFGTRHEKTSNPPAPQKPTHANGKPQPTAKSDGGGIDSNPYFRILGFSKTDNGVQAFYFFQKASNTLLRLTASAMSKNNLMTLAPLQWWEQNFAGAKGMATDMAIDWLIQTGSRKGQFNEKNVRGRGAWVDDKRIVIHAGDKLIADGKEILFHELKSKFVYEAGEEMDITSANPLTATEAKKLVEICGLLSWKRSINSDLLAGWCAVAPLCGALDWRPHLWIVGEAGSGKSTAFNEIVKRMLGGTALNVQGNTSESGLRQTLKFDARPVVFDEAEAEDRNAQARMQDVLALMRAASSSDGGKIIKGGQDGQAREYIIRSCFAYASIVFQATQQADISRITVLETKKINRAAEATERLGKFNRAVLETLTDDYVRRFQARAIKMLPTILENAKVFKSAVVQVLGQQRAGDQLGVLLAGAHSLHHDGLVDFAYALDLVQNADWSEEQGAEKQTDQMRLLSKIVEQVVRIEGRTERTVGELVSLAAAAKVEDFISERNANDTLKRLGLKVDKSELYISNTAEWVKRTLRDTAWANNHAKLLERIDGARKVASTRFADGLKGTATAIPLALLVDGED